MGEHENCRFDEMKRCGGCERLIALLGREIIRSKKAGKQNEAQGCRQKGECRHEFLSMRHPSLHSNPRIAGI